MYRFWRFSIHYRRMIGFTSEEKESRGWDSNPRPPVYERDVSRETPSESSPLWSYFGADESKTLTFDSTSRAFASSGKAPINSDRWLCI